MLNHVTLIGRMTRDPELRATRAGVPCTTFSLAVEREGRPDENGERKADFIDCVCWRQTANFVKQNFSKGKPIVVEGEIRTRFDDSPNGTHRKYTEVHVTNIYFVPFNSPDPKPAPASTAAPKPEGEQQRIE